MQSEIRRNLAATTTSKQAELHDRLTGYQVMGGVDYAMSDAVSLGIKGRWVRFGRLRRRRHRMGAPPEPTRRNYVSTYSEPVTFRIRTDGALSFVGVSLAMR